MWHSAKSLHAWVYNPDQGDVFSWFHTQPMKWCVDAVWYRYLIVLVTNSQKRRIYFLGSEQA